MVPKDSNSLSVIFINDESFIESEAEMIVNAFKLVNSD